MDVGALYVTLLLSMKRSPTSQNQNPQLIFGDREGRVYFIGVLCIENLCVGCGFTFP